MTQVRSEHVLSIDLGTSSVKTLVVALDGSIVGHGATRYPTDHPSPGHAEQNPDDWWLATGAAVKAALRNAAISPEAIRAVGLTGQMHGTVFLGANHRPVHPAVIWTDQRSAAEVRDLTKRIGLTRLHHITGSPLATGFQAATVHWFIAHRPEVWRHVAHVLSPKDELRLRLTGAVAAEPSDGSGTLLLDVHTGDWSQTLLDAVGLDRALLPRVQPSGSVAGTLSPDAARHLGLSANLPVITGAGDAPAAALGSGIVTADTLLLALSTGTQVYVPASTPSIDPHGRLHTFRSALEPDDAASPGWYQMGATLNCGLALEWCCRTVLGLSGPDRAQRLMTLAEESPPGARGVIFAPFLVGERTPYFDPDASGAVLGLRDYHEPADLARAVIEGVTLAAFNAYLALRATGAAPSEMVVVGGGARSDFWLQLAADVFDIPVRPLQSVDQSALGAAVLAAASVTNQHTVQVAADWVQFGEPIGPTESVAFDYSAHAARLDRLYHALKDTFASSDGESGPAIGHVDHV